MAKVGDIVFAKTFDVYTEETSVYPAIVTRVFTEGDGEWAKDRQIVGLTTFPHNKPSEFIDMDIATTDSNGEWVAGGWSESVEGPSGNVQAAVAEPVPVPVSTEPESMPNPEPVPVTPPE